MNLRFLTNHLKKFLINWTAQSGVVVGGTRDGKPVKGKLFQQPHLLHSQSLALSSTEDFPRHEFIKLSPFFLAFCQNLSVHLWFPMSVFNGRWPKYLSTQLDRPTTNYSNKMYDVALNANASWCWECFQAAKNCGLNGKSSFWKHKRKSSIKNATMLSDKWSLLAHHKPGQWKICLNW